MIRIGRLDVLLYASVVAGALLSAPSADAAEGACTQWDMGGEWKLIQTNDTAVSVTLKATQGGFSGQASFGRFVDDDFFLCSIAACGEEYVSFFGPAVGSINGDNFELTVYWSDNAIGVYNGKIGPQGLVVGTAYDKNNPGNRADWHSDRIAKCIPPPPSAVAPESTKPTMVLGRVQSTGTPAPAKTMCESAASARARNSPAAPGLERQCAAQTAQAQAAAAAAAAVAAAAKPVHDQEWWSDLATKGQALAATDPLATELRDLVPEGKSRVGFDYGMAVAETDTKPGPGKQAIRDGIGPDEQIGFDFAVEYSLTRNANADHAGKGAAVVLADRRVGFVRDSQASNYSRGAGVADVAVFYKLGFNIAAGIFGDKALGADGNTAQGPGSTSIRDALQSVAAQTGFDGAAYLLLKRGKKK